MTNDKLKLAALPAGRTPLDSQALCLPPLSARSRSLVRFARHLPIKTMDESFAGDFGFRDAGSRFSILKSAKTAPGPDECYGVFACDARPLFRKLLGLELGYWRGRTWIHGDTWYLGALWQSGFRQEADELADRILTTVGRSEGICKCYDSLTGFGNGHPEFMWSSAAVILIASGFHTGDPLATLTNETE